MRLFVLEAIRFFFNDTATTEIYTLSLHDALPILPETGHRSQARCCPSGAASTARSEEHTSELQSHLKLVCRLLLEKKKRNPNNRDLNATHHLIARFLRTLLLQ